VTSMLTVKNDSASQVTYSLSHAPAQATGPNTLHPTFLNAPANVSFAVGGLPAAEVTIPAGGDCYGARDHFSQRRTCRLQFVMAVISCSRHSKVVRSTGYHTAGLKGELPGDTGTQHRV
jgi:hypothetical protein